MALLSDAIRQFLNLKEPNKVKAKAKNIKENLSCHCQLSVPRNQLFRTVFDALFRPATLMGVNKKF